MSMVRSAPAAKAAGDAAGKADPKVVDLQRVLAVREKLDAAKATESPVAATAATPATATDDTAPLSAAAVAVVKAARRMYREMVPPTDVLAHLAQALGALGVDHRSWSVQTAVYELVLRDPLCVERYGPSPTYCDAFAKLYVHQIESAARSKHMAVDVHDGLYEESARLFKAAVVYAKDRDAYRGTQPRMCAKTFQMSAADDTDTLSIFFNEGLNHSLGLSAWPGGLFTAEFILHHRKLFAGRSCVELGAGVGFSSLALCYAGAKQVVSTDFEDEVLQLLANNLTANGFPPTATSQFQGAANTITVANATSASTAAAAATATAATPATTSTAIPAAAATASSSSSSDAKGAGSAPASGRGPAPSVLRVDKLDWFEVDDAALDRLRPDITIASDTIYAPELVPPQMRIFQRLLNAKSRKITSHLTLKQTAAPAADAKSAVPAASATATTPAPAPVRFVPPPTPVVELTSALYSELPVAFLILCVRNEDTFAYLLRCLYESGLAYAEVALDAVPRLFTYGRHALKCFRITRAAVELDEPIVPPPATPVPAPVVAPAAQPAQAQATASATPSASLAPAKSVAATVPAPAPASKAPAASLPSTTPAIAAAPARPTPAAAAGSGVQVTATGEKWAFVPDDTTSATLWADLL